MLQMITGEEKIEPQEEVEDGEKETAMTVEEDMEAEEEAKREGIKIPMNKHQSKKRIITFMPLKIKKNIKGKTQFHKLQSFLLKYMYKTLTI